MKKSIIPALLLSVAALSGLASCGGKKPTSTSTPGPVDEGTAIRDIISENFTGTPGEYTNGSYTLALKETSASTTVTVTGTYVSGAEWTYYEAKRSGYIMDANGDILFMHTAAEDANLKTDIKVGAKIKVTGTITAYNGYPQIGSGWTYEVITPAPATSTYDDIKSKYQEVTVSDLLKTGSTTELNLDYARKLVHLKNMVATGTFNQGDLTYFTPLDQLGKADALQIGVYRFHNEMPGTYTAGNIFDIYGAVTSYKGAVQLHATSQSTEDDFKGISQVDASNLTNEQKFAIAKLQGDLSGTTKEVTIDYMANETPSAVSVTLRKNVISGMSIYHKAEVKNGDATTDWFEITDDGLAKKLVINPLATKPTNNLSGTITLKRRVCLATDCADADAAFALVDSTKYDEQEVDISVKYIVSASNTFNATFTGNAVPSELSYITNNANYPNPSWGSGDYADAIKLAYANGGFETGGQYNFGGKVNVELNLAVAEYKTGERTSKIKVFALDANDNTVAEFISANLYDSANLLFRNVNLDLTSTGADIVKIKVIVDTSTNVTLYVKGITVTPTSSAE